MAIRPPKDLYQYRGHKRTVAPATEPVTADELRAYLVESATGLPDSEANALVAEAREMIEEATGLALITQTWQLALDHWPAQQAEWWDGIRQGSMADLYGGHGDVNLPRYPLQSLSSVKVYDETSTEATAGDIFDVDTFRKPGRITLKVGSTWPVALRANNAIIIEYIAGYGDAADVPASLKRAVKQIAAYLYSHKGDDCVPDNALMQAKSLLSGYWVARI